jgi:hypothetical protein
MQKKRCVESVRVRPSSPPRVVGVWAAAIRNQKRQGHGLLYPCEASWRPLQADGCHDTSSYFRGRGIVMVLSHRWLLAMPCLTKVGLSWTRNTALLWCFVVESPTFFTKHQQIIHGLSPTQQRFIAQAGPNASAPTTNVHLFTRRQANH